MKRYLSKDLVIGGFKGLSVGDEIEFIERPEKKYTKEAFEIELSKHYKFTVIEVTNHYFYKITEVVSS